jgi:hypothetical protein
MTGFYRFLIKKPLISGVESKLIKRLINKNGRNMSLVR